jgi:restriction endonuclease S subunit
MTYQALLSRLDQAIQLADPFSPLDLQLAQIKADLEQEQTQIEAQYQDWEAKKDYYHLAP